jgi:hypothetical protein
VDIPALWKQFQPIILPQIRHILTGLAGTLVGLGALQGGQTAQFVDIGTGIVVYLIGAGWTWWRTKGQALFDAKVEVLTAKTMAQAQALRMAKLPPVTVKEITQQSNMTLQEVTKVIPTLPISVQQNIAPSSLVPPVAKVVALFAILFLGLAWPGDVSAAAAKSHIRLPIDPLGLNAKPTTTATPATPAPGVVTSIDDLLTKLESIKNDVVSGVIGDIQAADVDAGTVITAATGNAPAVVNDPISHACYPAEVQFLQSLPVAKPTTGKYVLVQLFQKKRDFVNQLKAGLPAYLKIGCGALLGDETQIFIATMGMVGVTVATGGISGILPAAGLLPTLPALPL